MRDRFIEEESGYLPMQMMLSKLSKVFAKLDTQLFYCRQFFMGKLRKTSEVVLVSLKTIIVSRVAPLIIIIISFFNMVFNKLLV